MTKYTTQKLGEKYEQGFDWTTWLAGATLSSSTWSVSPATGLTLSGSTNNTTHTSVFGDITAVGTYRLRNDVTDSAGREGWDEILIYAEDTAAAGYLSTNDAEARLWANFGIEATITTGDLRAAENELGASGPFISSRYDSEQERAFPRSVEPDGTEGDGEVPDAILDAVSLLAYEMSREDEPPVKSRGLIGASITYERAAIPRTTRLYLELISPYLLKSGERL